MHHVTHLDTTEVSAECAFLALLLWQPNTDMNKKEKPFVQSPQVLNAQLIQKEVNLKS